MQALKETLFYSNFRPGLDVEDDNDRELLVQEQKSCRARVHKHSLETNRRRKALEERRRQWDVQEKRLRDKILQQRKQRVQDATERFQRAHLPPSQRRRSASGKRAPNLDQALNQINGALGSYSSFLSNTCAVTRSCTPSPKPPGGSIGPRSMRAVTAAEAYAKLMQERTQSDFKSNQLLFLNQLQEREDPQQACPQELQDTPPSRSDSLSSLDSLENEIPQQNPAHFSSPLNPTEVQDVRCPPSPQQLNLLCPSSKHSIPKSFFEEVLSQQDSARSSSPSLSPREDNDDSMEDNQILQDLTRAAEQCNLTEQSQGLCTQSTPSMQNLQDQAANSGHMAYLYNCTGLENISRDKGTITAHCKPPLGFQSLTQESKLHDGETLQHPPEMQTAQSAGRSNAGSSRFCNSALQQVESVSSKKADPSNLPNECNDTRVTTLLKPFKAPDGTSMEPVNSCPASQFTKVQFLKGILKKNSRYVMGDAKFTYTPGHFVFTTHVAMSIRDSMELARAKAREPESDKSMKKKLRWFDEVNGIQEHGIERIKKDGGKQPPTKSKQVMDQHTGYMNIPTGIPKTLYSTSSSPNSTRQAWTDVKLQEEPPEEPKVQKAGPRMTGPRAPRRVRSARAISGSATSRTRKGTIIRPQSASEAQSVVIRTQGKTMVPRPPPRSEIQTEANTSELTTCSTKTPYNNDCTHSKQDNPDIQLISQHHFLKADEGAMLAPVPPPYACLYETMSKGVYTLCQPEAHKSGARRENGICLDRTPTDEEISLLWHGVRNALASKEGDPRSFLPHNGPLSALPQGRANLSHVTNNDDSLLSGVKAMTRMGGIFLSPSNARTPVRRPTMESNMVKNRTYVDPKRGQVAAPGDRKQHVIYQATVPITGYSNKTDQIVHEGTEVVDSDGQIAVDISQLQRAGVVLQQRGQVFGLSALSLEEQRLLQSLDKLDHRLQCVQDMAAGNGAVKGIFALDSANNQSPQTGEVLGVTQRSRYHTGLAENRTRLHRR